MKKIDFLLIRSFVGPFLITFLITLFIFVMQFLWKYIDDLVGKGLEWAIVGELIFYASASFVPVALPLAVLLASIMTFGNLGEKYELVAIKSCGVSLLRFMSGLFVVIVMISIGTFFFANNILPKANLKFGSLLYDVRQQKPALNIKEGVFYDGIEGYSIIVGRKDPDNKTLYDIVIYDHTSGFGNDHVLMAKKGEMLSSEDERYLILRLQDGKQYRELLKRSEGKYEHATTYFDSWEKYFDLSEFNLSRTDESFFKDHYQMLNLRQLNNGMDTLTAKMHDRMSSLDLYVEPFFHIQSTRWDSIPLSQPDTLIAGSFLGRFAVEERPGIVKRAMNSARNISSYINVSVRDTQYNYRLWVRHNNEWHRKFTLATACIILFLIGAPLGAIIRKGGLGMPLVISIIFFIIYHVCSMTGEKMAEEYALSSLAGMWLPIFVLTPIGIFLTYKAANDSVIFNMDWYITFVKRLFGIFRKK